MNLRGDVLIVGGGPAGAAAAIWCAREGLQTILLEAQGFPRDAPGETLHPGVEPLLQQLGVLSPVLAAGFPRHQGHWVNWAESMRFHPFGRDASGPWRGFQAWRADFDHILLQGAQREGVCVLQPCKALDVAVQGRRLSGVRTSLGEIRTHFIVDASGRAHWFSKQMQLRVRRKARSLIAMYGYSRAGSDLDTRSLPCITGTPHGWTWIAEVKPSLVSWTRLGFNHWDKLTPAQLRGFEQVGPVRGADVTWRIVEACAGPGYFIVGDAASVLDPAASHGVLKALMSGMFAGDLICRIHRGSLTEGGAAEMFSEWLSNWFEHDTSRLAEFYSLLAAGRPAAL